MRERVRVRVPDERATLIESFHLLALLKRNPAMFLRSATSPSPTLRPDFNEHALGYLHITLPPPSPLPTRLPAPSPARANKNQMN